MYNLLIRMIYDANVSARAGRERIEEVQVLGQENCWWRANRSPGVQLSFAS